MATIATSRAVRSAAAVQAVPSVSRRQTLALLSLPVGLLLVNTLPAEAAKLEKKGKAKEAEKPKNLSRPQELAMLRQERKAALKDKMERVRAGETPSF